MQGLGKEETQLRYHNGLLPPRHTGPTHDAAGIKMLILAPSASARSMLQVLASGLPRFSSGGNSVFSNKTGQKPSA
jgi:hypothetical protein